VSVGSIDALKEKNAVVCSLKTGKYMAEVAWFVEESLVRETGKDLGDSRQIT
jgi:hypothetical protein